MAAPLLLAVGIQKYVSDVTSQRRSSVGIVASSFFPLSGGAERQCLMLARALQGDHELAWILTQHISPDSPRTDKVEGIYVYRVGAVGVWRRLMRRLGRGPALEVETSYQKALRRRGVRRGANWLKQSLVQGFLALQVIAFLWRRRRSVSVIVCFFFSPLEAIVCAVARALRISVVVRSANSREYLFQDLVGHWQQRSLLGADRVIAISSDIRKELLTLGVADSRIRLIPNGVDIPTSQWEASASHEYNGACIANLTQQPLKGIDLLIEAWAIVAEAFDQARLVICGRGNPSSLIELARRHGVDELIEFRGSVSDVGAVLLQSDLFVLPSRVEGMSNALLEAMAFGMPCVATAVSGSVDLIESGRNGMLVRPGDHKALAHGVMTMLASMPTRANFGAEARRSIQTGYSADRMVGSYRKVLGELNPSFAGAGAG